jgi:protein-S-isoprenylcysteine O-methyltransferase Ste14
MNKWKLVIPSCIWGPLLIAQIVMVLVFGVFNEAGWDLVMYIGWVIWAISLIFGFVPIFTLKRKGKVEKGKSYVHTKVIVDTGIYSVIRHPQYTAGIYFSLALVLWAQNWIILALGVVVIPSVYIDIVMADQHELEKFGDDYKKYMERVPRANFIWGIIKVYWHNKKENKL